MSTTDIRIQSSLRRSAAWQCGQMVLSGPDGDMARTVTAIMEGLRTFHEMNALDAAWSQKILSYSNQPVLVTIIIQLMIIQLMTVFYDNS